MTKAEYMEVLPFLSEWPAGLVDNFVEGMVRLQTTPLKDADVTRKIGVLMFCEHEIRIAAITEKDRMCGYMRSAGLWDGPGAEDTELREAIQSDAEPGTLDVLVVASSEGANCKTVIGVPVDMRWVDSSPGGIN